MPIKFSRAKMRIKDINGNYTTAMDVLTTQPMGTYIRQNVQPWIDGTTDGTSSIPSSNPAHNNNAKYYKEQAAASAAAAQAYATAAYSTVQQGYDEVVDKVNRSFIKQTNLATTDDIYNLSSGIYHKVSGSTPVNWPQSFDGDQLTAGILLVFRFALTFQILFFFSWHNGQENKASNIYYTTNMNNGWSSWKKIN